MATSFGVQIRGGRQLRASMKRAGMDIKQLTGINREAAETVATAARGRAPIGQPSRRRGRGRPKAGGALKASIRAGATTRAGVIRAGSSRVPYANVQHWGWPKRNIRPQHFISDAAIATEPVWAKKYEKQMNDVIKKVKGA